MGQNRATCPNVKTMSAAAKPAKAKKAAKPAAHPPYASMITAAIKGLKDKKRSSRQAILKYVVANNKVDAAKAGVRVKLALRKMVAAKKIVAAPPLARREQEASSFPPRSPRQRSPRPRRPRSSRLPSLRPRSLLPRRPRSQQRRPPSQRLPRSPQQRRPRSQPRRPPPRRSRSSHSNLI